MSRRLAFPSVLSATAAILILAAGCADQSPTAARLEASSGFSAVRVKSGTVVKANRRFDAGSYSKVITPNGGTIRFGIGQIDFPRGAVAVPTRITARVDGEHAIVDFSPDGLAFPEAARPILSIAASAVDADVSSVLVHHYADSGQFVEALTPVIDESGNRISVGIPSFSYYGLVVP